MIVNLGVTTKRRNSTLRPSLGKNYNCTLKEGCSIMNPTIRIDRAAISGNNYNYAYIPDFARYYWITDIRHSGALVYIDLAVDVLATYKAAIGDKDLYITRSSAESDGYLPDNLYPITNNVSYAVEAHTSFDTVFGDTSYVVGVVGRSGDNEPAGINYYQMSKTVMDEFFKYVLSSAYADAVVGRFMDTVNPNLKVMIDPLQYVSSIRMYPIEVLSDELVETVTSIPVGPASVPVTSATKITNAVRIVTLYSGKITIKHHPQAESRGEYLDGPQFTECSIQSPFGFISINPLELAETNDPTIYMTCDLMTGDGRLTIKNPLDLWAQQKVHVDVMGTVGIPVPVSQIVSGGIDMLSMFSGVGGMVASALTGNALGAATSFIGSAASAVGQATVNSIPKANTTGSQGTVLAIERGLSVHYKWYLVADDFNEERGRPLCKVRKPKNIPGYLMAADPDVAISGTEAEASELNSMLASGIFYE